MFLICHVIAKDHVFKGLCDFMSGSPSQQVTNMLRLIAKGFVVVEI